MSTTAALWLTIVALGLYHGLNPAMGWPLAVANGMTDRRASSVLATVFPLAGGHFAAVAIVLAPFALLSLYVEWSRTIRLGAGAAVMLFGLLRLVRPRHPRMMARIAPARLALWSFAMATAHGAGLMLAPFMLGLCVAPTAQSGHDAVMAFIARSNMVTALMVATAHSLAALVAGTCIALLVYRYLGLRFLRLAWFNLDRLWGASLVLAGAAGVLLAA